MKLTDFDFDLPQDLIAQKPSGKRGDDRLMLLDRKNGSVFHHQMNDLPDLIMPGTLMIFNNSKVRRARCYGIKETTGRNQEFMFLNQLDKEGFLWNTMVKSSSCCRDRPRSLWICAKSSCGHGCCSALRTTASSYLAPCICVG